MKNAASEVIEAFRVHPMAAVILALMGGFVSEYEPILRFSFVLVAGLISLITLGNKTVDTYVRFTKWRAKRRKK